MSCYLGTVTKVLKRATLILRRSIDKSIPDRRIGERLAREKSINSVYLWFNETYAAHAGDLI